MKAFATVILALLVLTAASGYAVLAQDLQDVREMKLPWKPGQRVILNLKFADSISIKAWDKEEVFLKAEFTINNGELNHAHTMDSIIDANEIIVVTDFDDKIVPKNKWCSCDENESGYTVNRKMNSMRICSEIYYTVYLPAGADLELETITGNITIVNMKESIDAKSISGKVDVIVPPGHRADIHLKTVMGRVSSDPDISTLVDGLKPMLSRKLNGKLNGGGKALYLESVTGNVSFKSLR